jgi:hypothetical protein
MKAKSLPFVHVHLHKNHSRSGRHSIRQARQLATYIAYGARPQEMSEQRGEWYSPSGTCSHEQVLAWVQEKGKQHTYTAAAVLSLPEGQLEDAAFGRALQGRTEIADWRLMAHEDTDHHHAHVLFFLSKRLPKEQFLAWQTLVKQALVVQIQNQAVAQLEQSPYQGEAFWI